MDVDYTCTVHVSDSDEEFDGEVKTADGNETPNHTGIIAKEPEIETFKLGAGEGSINMDLG